ncbi:MAG: hypothetical protein ACUVTP_08915 [Candidatus Fervidibacter sp.]|uniref:hypothetical protein n=1 Tax=Candidatus Fervidibacter sp. TaxID=3100871 RepID=UPI0040497C86
MALWLPTSWQNITTLWKLQLLMQQVSITINWVCSIFPFYTEIAALKLRDALSRFEGGKIIVGIAGFPYKCPPAPLEFTLLLDDWLKERGIRTKTEIVFVSPLPQVFSIPTVSPVFEDLFNRKGIRIETFFQY